MRCVFVVALYVLMYFIVVKGKIFCLGTADCKKLNMLYYRTDCVHAQIVFAEFITSSGCLKKLKVQSSFLEKDICIVDI